MVADWSESEELWLSGDWFYSTNLITGAQQHFVTGHSPIKCSAVRLRSVERTIRFEEIVDL